MIRSLWGLVLGLFVMLLSACGGGGSDAGDCVIGCSGNGGTTAKVAELRIAVSSNTIDLTSPSPVTVTITAVNAANQAVADAPVSVSVNEGGNILANATKTDSAGVLTAILDAGSKKTVRVMTITAVSGTITKEAAVAVVEGGPSSPVSDLRISVSSASIDAAAPAPVAVTVTAVNASNQLVSNAPVSLSVDAGALMTALASKTDGSGVVGGTLELGSNKTVRPLTVTAISGTVAKSVVVSVVQGSPSAPVAELRVIASTSTISNKAPAPVEVTVQAVSANNLPVSGAPIVVRADQGGVVTAGSATTSVGGTVTVTLGMGADTTPRVITLTATSGSQTGTGRVTVVDGFSGGTASVALSLSNATVSNLSPATVTAVLLDAKGLPIPNAVVSFSSQKGLGRFNANSALTDVQGRAQVQLSPATPTTVGADYVQASAKYSGSDLASEAGFNIVPTAVQISKVQSDTPSLSAYGQTNISLELTGSVPGVPVTIQATSQCAAAGKATLTPALVTTSNGKATFVLKDNQCGVNALKDTVTFSVVGSDASKALDIGVSAPGASSLAYVSATPPTIFLKGSGFIESSSVVFQVRDSSNNPLPGVPVLLSLVNGTGGLALEGADLSGTVQRASDASGQISVRVLAGTVPTPIRIRAELVSASAISTVSSGLSLAVGLPSQQNYSLSQQTENIEGRDYDGTPNRYTIIASDRMGNPVPDDTAVNFVAEGGQIASTAFTKLTQGLSSASGGYQSSEPRPRDMRVTVLAYSVGEESFLDKNGNNVWDPEEFFQDLGHPFLSRSYSITGYNAAVDQYFAFQPSSQACAPNGDPVLLRPGVPIPSIANTCDGKIGRNFVRRAVETVLSGSTSAIYIDQSSLTGAATGLGEFGTVAGLCPVIEIVDTAEGAKRKLIPFGVDGSVIAAPGKSLRFIVADNTLTRFNPMPAGTKVSIGFTEGLSGKLLGGSPVPSTLYPTPISVEIGFGVGVNVGAISITTTTPKEVSTTYTMAVQRAAAPSACVP
ncbi:Ig-like domain-containing protein [Ideonella sp.]|jgi:hypothetical protein|uniref:Ig-like domain-containing protein n=1 Tax=Ideonella sp. TaxID=1929293 RepID=UPI0037BEEE57